MDVGWRWYLTLISLLLSGLAFGQQEILSVTFSVLPHKYDCGESKMQLLVFPKPGLTIRFKVVDEFGTAFEVTNCSICRHWVTVNDDGAVVFSAGYAGCHVLKKDGRYNLKVRVEEILRSGRVRTSHDFTMLCPKPLSVEGRWPTTQSPPVGGHPNTTQNHLPTIGTPGKGNPSQEKCQVVGSKIYCLDVRDAATCNQAGCCYDGNDPNIPCYYGNTVTVQCLQGGYFILAISRNMLDNPIVLDSVRLSYAQSGCDPVVKTEAFLVFRFPLTHCGTTVQVIGDKLIYENQLVSGISILSRLGGSITRDSTFTLHARCIYNATDFLPVKVEVALPPTPSPVLQMGPLHLELRIAIDSSYSSYYSETDYPVVKVLRNPVHVEVRILQRTDPSLVLVLHECWATPSANPLEQLQWPILVNGCPFEGDNYRIQPVSMGPATSELPFPTHYQRFIISTFTFVDSAPQSVLDGLVYIYCAASACHPSQLRPCRTTCSIGASPRSRRFLDNKDMADKNMTLDLVSSVGALLFAEETKKEASHSLEDDVVMNIVILGLFSLISVVSFIMISIRLLRRNQKMFLWQNCTAAK